MIGADPTINPEIPLQGLSSTDPALLQQESLAGQEVAAKAAQAPSEMALRGAEAWQVSAEAYWKNWMDNLLPASKHVDQIVRDRLKATYDPEQQSGSTSAPTGASTYGYNQNVKPSTGPLTSGGPNG
jgi:hypothetical protein